MNSMVFKINIKPAARTVSKNSSTNSFCRISKKTVGKVFLEDGQYIIRVPAFEVLAGIDESSISAQLVLPFTKQSFELKGKERVFSTIKDHDRYVCYIRTKDKANRFPGLKSQYTTVAPNWICSGWVVREDGKLKFDLSEPLAPDGYEYAKQYDDD